MEIPDGTTQIHFTPEVVSGDKLFRNVDIEVKLPLEEDSDDGDYNEASFINFRARRYNNKEYDLVSSEFGIKSETLITSTSLVGTINDSIQIRLNPYHIMTGINVNRSIRYKMEADLVDGTTKTAYLKMTLNGKS
jgi:hypothetical protein